MFKRIKKNFKNESKKFINRLSSKKKQNQLNDADPSFSQLLTSKNSETTETTDFFELYFDTKQSLDEYLKKIIFECNTLLDIGCGINPSNLVVPKIFHIFLEPFDQYSKVLDYRIRNYKKSIIVKQDGITFLKSLSDNSIDIIFMFDVIEHMEKEEGHELLKEAMRVCNKQIILSTPLGFLPQEPECKDAWNLDGIESQTHRSGWEPKDFQENWKFLICKKYWEHNVGGEIYTVPTFFALYNKLGQKSFDDQRVLFDKVPDYFKTEFNLG
jgi:hypothetical protein